MKLLAILSAATLTATLATGCNSVASSQQANNKNKPKPDQTNTETKSKPAQKEAARIQLAEAKAAFDAGKAVFVDTRDADQFKAGHIKGAINMGAAEVAARFAELPKDKQIIAYCS